MGEIADMMVDGDMCQSCGEYLGDGDGYARFCAGCKPKREPPKTYGKGNYMVIAGSKHPVHIVNPDTKRSYCQAENNATWTMFREKEVPRGRRLCKNCEGLKAKREAVK
jgi:hypothetical protein